jgi:hypothetical protein
VSLSEFRKFHAVNTHSVFDLKIQVESTTGGTGITGKSKINIPCSPWFVIPEYPNEKRYRWPGKRGIFGIREITRSFRRDGLKCLRGFDAGPP